MFPTKINTLTKGRLPHLKNTGGCGILAAQTELLVTLGGIRTCAGGYCKQLSSINLFIRRTLLVSVPFMQQVARTDVTQAQNLLI